MRVKSIDMYLKQCTDKVTNLHLHGCRKPKVQDRAEFYPIKQALCRLRSLRSPLPNTHQRLPTLSHGFYFFPPSSSAFNGVRNPDRDDSVHDSMAGAMSDNTEQFSDP